MNNIVNKKENYLNNSISIDRNELIIHSHHKDTKIHFSDIKNIFLKKTADSKINKPLLLIGLLILFFNFLDELGEVFVVIVNIFSSMFIMLSLKTKKNKYNLIIILKESPLTFNIPKKYKNDAKEIISRVKKSNISKLMILITLISLSCNNKKESKNDIVYDNLFKQKINSILKIEDVHCGILYIKFYNNGKYEEIQYNPDCDKIIGTWTINNNLITINGLYSIKSIQILNLRKDRIELYLIKNNYKAIDVVGIFLKDENGNNIEDFSKIETYKSASFFD